VIWHTTGRSQVKSYYYQQLVSQSVHLVLEPLTVIHGHILAFEEYLGIVFRVASTVTGGLLCRV